MEIKQNDPKNISYEEIESLLNEIFIHKKIDNKIEYQPLLVISKNLGENLKLIFIYPDNKITTNINLFHNFITNKIELFKKVKQIIDNSYEILDIIINYLSNNKINPIIYFIDLYFDFICMHYNTNNNNELLLNLKNILIWFLSCGFMDKKYIDYIFQRIAKLQFEQKLTSEIFYCCLSLTEIFYGKDYDCSYKRKLIAKNYIYFYDKENSMLKTNISNDNNIFIKDGCSTIMWFYIKDDNVIGSKLFQITIEKDQMKNQATFEFILNKNYDIDINANAKNNCNILKEQENKTFKLKKNKWIQLKIEIKKSGIKLSFFQNYDEIDQKKSEGLYYKGGDKIKYETKLYQTNNKKCLYNNDLNFDLNNFNIIDLKYFVNYAGYAGTIIFCSNINPSETPINSLYGLKSNKISNFIADIGLNDIFFIFSPSLYNYQKNKFIYMNNNIFGELSFSDIKEPYTIINYNYVYRYNNYINNIYKLGGMINILPLFEIFYKFTKDDNINNKNHILNNIFYKLIKIIEFLIVNKEKNYFNIYYNNNLIFESLQLFLENIDEQYYQYNNDILLTLINIGYYVFEYCKQKSSIINKSFDNYYLNNNNIYNYFKYILFYPKIVLKFSLDQQNKIWSFFEDIKSEYKKKQKLNIKLENYIFQHSSYRKCFLTFEQINYFIILFNEKYPNEFLSPNLTSIIKNIFFDSATNDNERESLFLLINKDKDSNNQYRLSHKIIMSIIEIFTNYLDAKDKKFISNNSKVSNFTIIDNNTNDNDFYNPKMSIKSFLSSPNYFIEELLSLFSVDNLNLKKVLITLLRTISQKYDESLNNYFINIEKCIKKSKKNQNIQRVTKEEFYFFIQENIAQKYNNENIRELRKLDIYDSENNNLINNDNKNDKERRKSSMDSINIVNGNNYREKNNYKIDIKNYNIDEKIENKYNRSKSCKSKHINEIKTKIIQKNDNFLSHRRNTYFDSSNNLRINPKNLNFQNQIGRISYDRIKIEKKNNNNNKKDENIINEKERNKEQLKIQKTNCEISMILFDWLLNIDKKLYIKKDSSGNLSSLSNITSDKNLKLSDTIVNFILKFLCSNKNLEVIYKLLFIIIGQKGNNFPDSKNKIKKNLMPMSPNYIKLLAYFSSSKTNFLQFLEELMINSYLCLHYKKAEKKFNYVEEYTIPHGANKNKDEYFQTIYEKTKELIIDIYFSEFNLNKNNDIINEIINIVLSLCNGLKNIKDFDKENEKIRDILFDLLKEFLNNISEIYTIILGIMKKKINKKPEIIKQHMSENISLIHEKNDKSYSDYKTMKKNYAIFTTFIFEYYLLLINSNNYMSNTFDDLPKLKNFAGISDFLKYQIDKNGEKKQINMTIDIYLKIYHDIIDFFNIEKLLQNINSSSDKKKLKKEKEEKEGLIFYFEPKQIIKLVKEISINRELKNKLKEKLELLFLSYKEEFKFLPLITIITILNNFYINYFINIKSKDKNNFELSDRTDFMHFLNSHMQFILMIIFVL